MKKYIKIHQTHIFLVACYATLHPALEVRWSVDPSVRPSHFIIFFFLGFGILGFTAPAKMICGPQLSPLPTYTHLG